MNVFIMIIGLALFLVGAIDSVCKWNEDLSNKVVNETNNKMVEEVRMLESMVSQAVEYRGQVVVNHKLMQEQIDLLRKEIKETK